MRSLVMPFGKAGWEEKIRFLEEVISSRPRPPFIYSDILILVPSSRLKRLYGRVFLDAVKRMHDSTALVQPEIQTLYQFLQRLFAGLHGPLLIDENSRLVLIEGLVKETLARNALFHQDPDLLAPSLSSVLAKTIEQLSAAGIGPKDLSLKIAGREYADKPQVTVLTAVYERYQESLRDAGLIDPSGMLAYLCDHFDRAWISQYRTVVIDGLQNAQKLEAEVLKKTTEAVDSVCIVDASPELFRETADFHPLRIVKEFLSQIGATVQPGPGRAHSDDAYLSSVLFSAKPFEQAAHDAPDAASFEKEIELLSTVSMREEVSLIAGEVKKSLQRGTSPDRILVAFPALDQYGPLMEEVFSDYGVPYNRALGRQLSTSAVATAIVSLLRASQEDFSAPSLLRVFSSPFLKFSAHGTIAPALDRFMRSRKITGGREKLLSALRTATPNEHGKDILPQPLEDLFSALEPFSRQDSSPLVLWMNRLSDLLAWSQIAERVNLIKGPLNTNLQAYKKLQETLFSLEQAGTTFRGYTYTFSEWLFLLKKTFMHARFQVPPEDEGGVQVLGLEESLGLPWDEIYLGGLVDSKFPQRLPQNIFLPEQTLESLGVRTLERARLHASYAFYRLLLSANKVVLTHPENEGDRSTVPSPFLQELTPLRKAGLLNRGIEKTSGIQFSLKIEDSRSVPELAKAIAVAISREQGTETIGDREWLRELTARLPSLAPQLSAIGSGMHDERQRPDRGMGALLKRRFSVTELDAYLACPYDYYVVHVLGIEPLEEVSEDISALDRGSAVHGILRNFYLSWRKPVTQEARAEARELLLKLADSAFAALSDTFRNRREKHFFSTVIAERFLAAEIGFWKQGMRPAYLERKIASYPLFLSNGEEVELSATIDRIDVDDKGNFIIVDYKTGRYPGPKMNGEQDIFQLPVYAVMCSSLPPETGAQLRNPVGLAYYDLSGRISAVARDVVLFNRDVREDHPCARPKASAKSTEEFQFIVADSIERARKAVEGILAGNFTNNPQDENKCRFCPNETLCGRGEKRSA